MTDLPNLIVSGITFEEDAVVIQYMQPNRDLRENGLLLQHALSIPVEDDYDDEIRDLIEAAHLLLLDALDDHRRLPAYQLPAAPAADEDEDDD